MHKSVGIIGCGWLGLPLAQKLITYGYTVYGSTTTFEKLAEIENKGISACLLDFDGDKEYSSQMEIFNADFLVINFPPKRNKQIHSSYPRQIQQLIRKVTNPETKIIFISSTSVYPETNNWVTEEDAILPDKPTGKAILLAEGILKSQFKDNLAILRMGGLFGDGRDYRIFLKKSINEQNADVPLNLVHQKDCIEIIAQIINKGCFNEVFNVVSDKAVTRREIFQMETVSKISIPPNSYKLVDNNKLKRFLDYEFIVKNPLTV